MCEIAGSPVEGFSVVSSTAVSAARGVEKFFDGCHARAEIGCIAADPAAAHRRTVAQRVDAGDGEWKIAALRAQAAAPARGPRCRIR